MKNLSDFIIVMSLKGKMQQKSWMELLHSVPIFFFILHVIANKKFIIYTEAVFSWPLHAKCYPMQLQENPQKYYKHEKGTTQCQPATCS
jgi:hypothetical protein